MPEEYPRPWNFFSKKKFIKIYDNILPPKGLTSLIKYCNFINFEEANVGEGATKRVDFQIRRTFVHQLSNRSESMTEVHWCNLLYKFIKQYISRYKKELNINPRIIRMYKQFSSSV